MKNVLLIVIAIMSASATHAQNFWERVSEFPQNSVISLATDRDGRMFAGVTNGSIYRSTDNGQSWISYGLIGETPLAMAVYPSSAGKLFFIPNYSYGRGYFSSDTGKTWTPRDSFQHQFTIAIAVNSNGKIFVSTEADDLFRSLDDGATWTSVRNNLPSGFHYHSVRSIVVSPTTGRIFIASAFDSTVYSSTNEGSAWIKSGSGISGGVGNLAVNTSGDIFAFSTSTSNYNSTKVYRSTNEGTEWTHVGGIPAGLAFTVVSAAVNSLGHIFVWTYRPSKGVYRSTDNGSTWEKINSGLTDTTITSFTFDKNGMIYAGILGGGLFRSVNSTTSSVEDDQPIIGNSIICQNYPNPFSQQTTIPLKNKGLFEIRDILGRVVYQTIVTNTSTQLTVDVGELANGLYLYSLSDGLHIQSRMMMVMK